MEHASNCSAEYLRGLFRMHGGKDIPISTDPPETWLVRLKAYPGDVDNDKAHWDQEFATEELQRRLLKDKAFLRDSRQKLALGLGKAAILFELPVRPIAYSKAVDYLASGQFVEPRESFPIHPQNLVTKP